MSNNDYILIYIEAIILVIRPETFCLICINFVQFDCISLLLFKISSLKLKIFYFLTALERLSQPGSPDRMEDNRSWQSSGGNNFNSAQQQDIEEVRAFVVFVNFGCTKILIFILF